MPEPLTMISLGAAIGGGAGKFVEKAWDSGEKWVVSHFANHQETAKAKAIENSTDFLRMLGKRVTDLETNNQVSEEFLSTAQEHPDFSVVLQKAILSAAQTESQSKHDLLSRLVAERIQATPESLVSMASKMACDVIAYTTPNQLLILGLLANVLYVVPSESMDESRKIQWIQTRLSSFIDVNLSNIDYTHLESLSCMKVTSIISRDLSTILKSKFGGAFDFDNLKSTPLGEKLTRIWQEDRLKTCELTTVGQMLGVMVSDQQLDGKTSFSEWG